MRDAMSFRKEALSIAVLILLATAGCGPWSGAKNGGSSQSLSKLVSGACPFKVGGGAFTPSDVECGYVVMRENRSAVNHETIKLAVAIFKARDPHPAADPLIY